MDRDRVPDPDIARDDHIDFNLQKYAVAGRPVFVRGIYQENGTSRRYEARDVYLLHSDAKRYRFEGTHWWPAQVTQMADRILDHLFDVRRSYTIDDFSELYRTNLNILGQPTDETVQECAVLSRLLYDLSSAYLMTGAERYLMAARAAANYLREAFRSLSHDGRYCFWAYGRKRNIQGERGEFLLFASQGPDDQGTIPLYEQIYALAGLTQYYRVTLDWEVLEDIRRTINTFQDYFWDPPSATEKGFAGKGGYYSHLDPATMRPDTVPAAENRSKKNWNSVGDHVPAYLVNLILSLEPLPQGDIRRRLEPLLAVCRSILAETSSLICEKFPDPESDFVFERFTADWTPDLTYRWQQNRAVVGHNLKIAWNLTRCAYYFQTCAKRLRDEGKTQEADGYVKRSDRCLEVAQRLADRMGEVGLDKIRGGIFDCVERNPNGGMPTQFAWGATKDFWQQEQGILAYLILYGATGNPRLSASGAGILGLLESVLPRSRTPGLLFPDDRERPADPRRTVRDEEQPRDRLPRFRTGLPCAPLHAGLRRGGRGLRQQLLPLFQGFQHGAGVDQRAARFHAARPRAHHVRSRQRGGHDGEPGSGQPR